MSDNKITVSLDEVNSAKVDSEINRQNIVGRMGDHQEKIRVNIGQSKPLNKQGAGFRKSIIYMALFGFIFSVMAWTAGEIIWKIQDDNPVNQLKEIFRYIHTEKPNMSNYELRQFLQRAKDNIPKYRNNEYLPDKIINMNQSDRIKLFEDTTNKIENLSTLNWVILGIFIAVGLSIAEGCVTKNMSLVKKNGFIAAVLGAIGGFIVSLFIDQIYRSLGGGSYVTLTVQQVFARSVGWGILGMFIAIAPGIVMKSGKKFMLGIAGGLVGGLIGGILFDPIIEISGSVGFARFINIVGLGVGAAVATVLLENIAKQGWLKVTAGLIAGKQFIIYRNPTVIGSSPKCEIYLFKDSQVAARHVAINNINGDFIVTSIGQATVLVNNIPIQQQKLKTGDSIKVGNTVCVFEARVLKNQNT